MSYEPLHHKYRPKTFAELVGQEAIATTLTNAIRSAKIATAYLFTGPRGTGKTSSARILAKSLNCLSSPVPTAEPCGVCDACQGISKGYAVDVIEIDAASNTGVDNIREIIERAQFAPVQCRYKVYVIDECHMLSTAAFNALLKTLEEPPKHVVFVLATTDPQRVLPTIISRCQRFDYRRIPLEAMIAHLRQIAINENIPIREDAIRLVAQLSQGGLRDAESLLDQLSLLSGEIVPESVWNLVGTVSERDLLNLVDAIATDNPQVTIESVRAILDRGREPLIILHNLAGFYRDLLIAKTAPNRPDLVACTEETWSAMVNYAQNFPVSALLHGQQHLRSAEVQLKNSTQPRLWLEVTLLGLLPSATVTNTTVVTSSSPPVSKASFSPPSVEQPPTPPPPPAVHPPQSSPTPPPPVPTSPPTVEPPPPTIPPPVQPVEQPVMEESVAPVYDYGQIWQQVLMQIEPISRRELLRQMCQVVYMDDISARVAIKSAWYKRVQEDLPVITSAFSAVLNRHIHVSLESANNFHSTNHLATENRSQSYQSLPKNISSPPSSTTTVKLPTHSFVNHPQVQKHSPQTHQVQNHSSQTYPTPNSQVQNDQHPTHPTPNPQVPNYPNQPVQTNNYQSPRPTEPGVSPSTQTPIPSKIEAENKQPYNPPVEIQETPKNPVVSSPVSSVEVEAILNAAKKLAEFFDGKIVTDQDGSDFGAIDSGMEFSEEIDGGDD